MDIKVIGVGCDKCDKLFENAKVAASSLGIQDDIQKVEDLMEIVKLGVMTSPSLMVNGKLVVSGRVATADQVRGILKQYL